MEPSANGNLRYEDLAGMPDDGQIREVLDGVLVVTPAPSPSHQRVVKRLARQLDRYFELHGTGEVFIAPLDVLLGPFDIAEPDLLVVTDPSQVTPRAIEGPPALVIEVLSPSTAGRDRTVKARRYAAPGVAQYWQVDIEHRRIECLRLHAGAYERAAVADGDVLLMPEEWSGLVIDLAALWR